MYNGKKSYVHTITTPNRFVRYADMSYDNDDDDVVDEGDINNHNDNNSTRDNILIDL